MGKIRNKLEELAKEFMHFVWKKSCLKCEKTMEKAQNIVYVYIYISTQISSFENRKYCSRVTNPSNIVKQILAKSTGACHFLLAIPAVVSKGKGPMCPSNGFNGFHRVFLSRGLNGELIHPFNGSPVL